MLNKWILENFKSIHRKTSLEIAPLTIFAGANSSGKSTVLQSILLTAQTIQSQVSTRPVVLNGHILQLGAFNDIISNLATEGFISIGFELIPSKDINYDTYSQRKSLRYYSHDFFNSINSINCVFNFSATGNDKEKNLLQLQPKIEYSSIETKITRDKKEITEEIQISRSKDLPRDRLSTLKINADPSINNDLMGLEYEVTIKPKGNESRRFYGLPKVSKLAGAVFQHFIPSNLVVVYDNIKERNSRLIDNLFSLDRHSYYDSELKTMNELPSDFLNKTFSLVNDIDIISLQLEKIKIQTIIDELRSNPTAEGIRKVYKKFPPNFQRAFQSKIEENRAELERTLNYEKKEDFRLTYYPLNEISEGSVEYIQTYFSENVKYLGPLRDEPKPVYPLAGSIDPKNIGFKGENTAAVIELYQNTIINYIKSEDFENNFSDFPIQTKPLIDGVIDWLKYLGVANQLKTLDKGKLGHELTISTMHSNSLHDLTHVGVGVSQVLPILVQSLLSEKGSTLIFEQPELHLHPRVQTRLADFFISMIMTGKQCIIETHSEYLINRLRFMSAFTKNDELSNNIILYFVEKEAAQSSYKPIRINKYGVIEDWPKGFFDENEQNASEILRAGMLKRKNELNLKKKENE